ncbi:MAG: alpha/beta hydrolase [Spongiibacteraceae bacterium]|nr:alpha/beta hydrolase [Spongiibacteraceae bacterium]
MPYAKSDTTTIYYETHGEGPAVLFVHGSGGNHAAWWQQTAVLMKDYQVINIDLRGFGKSDPVEEGPDAQDFPEDILAVLEHAGVSGVVAVGQSIGAAAALKAALRDPSRIAGVVLAHSLGGISHADITPLVKADRAQAEKMPVIDRLLTKRFQQEEFAKTFLFKQMGTFNQARMQDLRNLALGGPSIDDVIASGVKVCFLTGEHDKVLRPATVRKAHELLEGSMMIEVPGGPHSMYWEAPEKFNTALLEFLTKMN